ncbi:hypothetical protein HPP92_011515 [Vanilla planifolia]|uniref:protein-serine/threonine phosphatase n=1 Tax=Vanilla planifolia TaxID=51239 RepID=A0A835V537_VANPL|nr:hypothetical protein HPP92_011515 [Vanilla planifolia]
MTPNHRFFVIASDGVFEFLSSQTVVDMVASFKDPRDASSAIAAKSYELWLEQENRTDDITIIIVHIRDLSIAGPEACSETTQTRMQTLAKPMNSTDERSMPSGSSPRRHQETLSEHPLVPQAACVAPQAHPMSLEMKHQKDQRTSDKETGTWQTYVPKEDVPT